MFLENLYFSEKPIFGIKAAIGLICSDFVSNIILTPTS